MSRRQKQSARLHTIELDLRRRLTEALERVARGENTLFFTTAEYNPFQLPAHMLPSVTAELSELASEALSLRLALGETIRGSVGEVFQDALCRAGDTSSHNRLGPIRHARELLTQLTGGSLVPPSVEGPDSQK